MVDIEFIRKKHYVEGWSIRKISRNLAISRQSVRKALASAQIPQYKLTKPRPSPVMDPYRDVIKAWLEADQHAPPKQRHTAKRIYDRLVEEYGFTGGESTVRYYVRKLRADIPEVFIPLQAELGEQAQVDWGQATVSIAGHNTVAHLFCLRLKASGVAFVQAYPTEKLEALLAGHRSAFEWLGGVPARCVYDNPKTVVVKILAGPHRREQTVFSSLRAHYLFESNFCGVRKAHEKGAVENLVGYVRRNALVPVMDFAGWEELNAHLLRWCIKDRGRRTLWEAEQQALRPLPAKSFSCALTNVAVVSKTSLVTVERNRYSVPCQWAGQSVLVSTSWDRVRILTAEKVIAEHQRSYGRGETILELAHYLPILARKPRAAIDAKVVRQLGGVWSRVRELLLKTPDGYREFARILLLHRDWGMPELTDALERALKLGAPTAEVVRQLLLNDHHKTPEPVPVDDQLSCFHITPPNLGCYDTLTKGVG